MADSDLVKPPVTADDDEDAFDLTTPSPIVNDDGDDDGADASADDTDNEGIESLVDAADTTDDLGIEDEDEDEESTGELFIHSPKCLECSFLVPSATKRFKSCHHTNGNENCPAIAVQIVVRLGTAKIVRSLLDLEAEGDLAKLSEWYAKLATKPAWGRNQIMADIQAERLRRAGVKRRAA